MKNFTSAEKAFTLISGISLLSLLVLLGLNTYTFFKMKDIGSQTACCEGIYFRTNGNAIGRNIKIKIVYTYDNIQSINETVELLPMTKSGQRQSEYFFQPFLVGCSDGTRVPHVTFFAIDSSGTPQVIPFGSSLAIPIERRTGDTPTPVSINFRVTNEGAHPCCDAAGETVRTVYTVEMN